MKWVIWLNYRICSIDDDTQQNIVYTIPQIDDASVLTIICVYSSSDNQWDEDIILSDNGHTYHFWKILAGTGLHWSEEYFDQFICPYH